MSHLLFGFCVVVAIYLAVLGGLLLAGRRTDAVAVARFIPDCIVLIKRLLVDPRVARRHKLLLGVFFAYLVSPIDLVPDFLPVIGQADDAIILGLTLRWVLGSAGEEVIRELWPGPEASLRAVLALSGQ